MLVTNQYGTSKRLTIKIITYNEQFYLFIDMNVKLTLSHYGMKVC